MSTPAPGTTDSSTTEGSSTDSTVETTTTTGVNDTTTEATTAAANPMCTTFFACQPAESGQMCSQLEFSAASFGNGTSFEQCGLMVSINATPALAFDGESLGLPPAGRRRDAAYVLEFTFAMPVRPLSLELVGVAESAAAGTVRSVHLYGGALNITTNVTSLVAIAPATTTTTTAAATTAADTTTTGTADGSATTTADTTAAASDSTTVGTTAAVEAPPATTTSIRIEVDDATVRFKALKVQVASTATTTTVAATTGSDQSRGIEAPGTVEWYLMEAGPLVLWMWLAIGGGVLLLAIIIIAVVCIVRRKGSDDDDDMEMYSHRDMSPPAPVSPPMPVRSAFDEAPSSAGNTLTSESADKQYASLNEFKVATGDTLPPPPLSETRDSTYQALPSQGGSARY